MSLNKVLTSRSLTVPTLEGRVQLQEGLLSAAGSQRAHRGWNQPGRRSRHHGGDLSDAQDREVDAAAPPRRADRTHVRDDPLRTALTPGGCSTAISAGKFGFVLQEPYVFAATIGASPLGYDSTRRRSAVCHSRGLGTAPGDRPGPLPAVCGKGPGRSPGAVPDPPRVANRDRRRVCRSRARCCPRSWPRTRTAPGGRSRPAGGDRRSAAAGSQCGRRGSCPDVGSISPASRRSSVDFPDPERPTIATVVPGATSRLIPATMGSLASGG